MSPAPARPVPALQCVSVELIVPLRHAVLRHGMPVESAHFDGDGEASTLHLAAIAEARVVACASFMKNHFTDEPAYQLRGMATDPTWRGVGLGGRLLAYSEELLRDDPIRLRWCNARSSAIGFYVKQGWMIVSEEFDIPTAGPHRQMIKRA